VEVSGGGAGKGMADALNKVVDIGMVSREVYQEEKEQGAFWVSVTKDCVVCIINENNPVVNEIITSGLTRDMFKNIFMTRTIETWGVVTNNLSSSDDDVRVYTRSDACGAGQMWAAYLGNYTQDDLTNSADAAVETEPGLVSAVASDSLGIGYGNLNSVYDGQTKKPVDGVVVVPIDLNNNSVLDDTEKFYETRDGVMNAVKNDIYPSPPARELYLVTKESFKGKAKDFVRWILTDGQQYVPDNGYVQLSTQKIQQELNFLERGNRE
jgi:phosphate transport system substrate-binding protein